MISNLITRSFAFLFFFTAITPVVIGHAHPFSSEIQNPILLGTTFIFVATIIGVLLVGGVWKWSDIGFRPEPFFKGFWWYPLVWGAALLVAGPYARFLGFTKPIDLSQVSTFKLVLWSGIFCHMQDILYWGFLANIATRMFAKSKVVPPLLVITLFIGMHSLFPRPLQVMAFVAPGAVIFTLLYREYKNMYLITLTHSILSLIAFSLGVFHY